MENVDIDFKILVLKQLVSTQTPYQIRLRVKPWTSFAKIRHTYAKRIGKSESSLRFKFQGRSGWGRLIDDKDTPESLGSKHSDGNIEEIQVDCQNCGENPCEEDIERLKQDLLAQARKRKDAARERSEKKVKNVSITGDREAPYDLEKVLKALGEVSPKIV